MNAHTIRYQILNKHQHDGVENFRDVDVAATPEELTQLDREGYLARESLFKDESLEQLQAATDRLFESEVDLDARKRRERSWGSILRYLEDKDPAFLDLIQHDGLVSIARAMMGPMVRVRGLSCRISWPGEEVHTVPYHQHLRVNTLPRPPWFSEPHALDVLIYLDDLDDGTGPVCVVPGSHKWVDREPPYRQYDPVENEVVFRVPAGSAILMHANVWHRAFPTVSARRRMLILSYTPCWMRRSPYGRPPEDRLTETILETADEPLRELLGKAGHS